MIPEMALLKKLSDQFGPLQSTNGVITRPDGSEIPKVAIENARAEIDIVVRYSAVKEEAARRILVVTKDVTTQINIVIWLTAGGHQDAATVRLAKKVLAWIDQTRMTARQLKDNPQFREDHLWPKPPDGARELMDRF